MDHFLGSVCVCVNYELFLYFCRHFSGITTAAGNSGWGHKMEGDKGKCKSEWECHVICGWELVGSTLIIFPEKNHWISWIYFYIMKEMEALNQKSIERVVSQRAFQMGSSFPCQICVVGFLCGVCLTSLFLAVLTSFGGGGGAVILTLFSISSPNSTSSIGTTLPHCFAGFFFFFGLG